MDTRLIENIKKYRVENNLSTHELSCMIGKSDDYIDKLENKILKKNPTIELLMKIADVLNIEIGDLFENRK